MIYFFGVMCICVIVIYLNSPYFITLLFHNFQIFWWTCNVGLNPHIEKSANEFWATFSSSFNCIWTQNIYIVLFFVRYFCFGLLKIGPEHHSKKKGSLEHSHPHTLNVKSNAKYKHFLAFKSKISTPLEH